MKIRILLSGIFLAAAAIARAANNDLTGTLQKGLFEEEANHNLGAAIQAYQAVVNQFDNDRKLAATAVFRLAECYRKQGATNEATAQYQRVLREFPDQAPLVASSRQSLTLLGATPAASAGPNIVGGTDPEQQEIRRIQELLEQSPDLINAPGKSGETLLQAAAAKGQLNVVQTLLNWGAGVNVNRPSNISPLHYAAGNGHKSVVDVLLQHAAKIDPETGSGVTPLHLAALKGYTLVAKALIDAGAQVNARVKQNVNRSEADLSYNFAGGESPLDLAIANGSAEIVTLLLAAKADVNSRSPLLNAAVRGENPIVELLLDHGADLAAVDSTGNSALHLAAQSGNPELLDLLLARKVDINARNRVGMTPLHKAAEQANGAIVSALLAKGADINSQDQSGKTPLATAVSQGRVEVTRVLLANKADTETTDSSGLTPLQVAVSRGDTQIVRLLLEAGAEPNTKNPNTGPPVILAAERGNLEILGLLLDHKAKVDAAVAKGKTALMIAADRREKAMLELLLAHKANANARDSQGNSALHFLAFSFFPNRPGTPFPSPPTGMVVMPESTPSLQNESAIAESLLAAGADVNAQNNEGKTPLQYATQMRPMTGSAQAELAAVLRKHGALENPPDFSAIRVTRAGFGQPLVVFRSDTNGINQFTLAEVLLNFTGLAIPPGAFGQAQQSLAFPDLSHIKINRYSKSNPNEPKEILVNMLNSTNGIDCAKDIPLQFGDEIEIPEREHALSEPLVGLTEPQRSDLRSCLKRKVTFRIKEQTIDVTLFGESTTWLANAINSSTVRDVLRSSSDLSRVHIRRVDPIGGGFRDFVRSERNFTNPGPLPGQYFQPAMPVPGQGVPYGQARDWDGLWLRDGDVIEVPDKP